MKIIRKTIVLIILVSLVSGCDVLDINKSTKDVIFTYEEVGKKYDYEEGTCLVDGSMVRYGFINRDKEIEIIDEDDNYYYFIDNELVLAIDKKFVRTTDEEYEQYTAFTKRGAVMYSDLKLKTRMKSFELNDEVNVIDEFDDVLIVKDESKLGYMLAEDTSKTKIVVYVAPKIQKQEVHEETHSSGGGGGGGGGGGNPTPAPSPTPAPTSGDGQIVGLAFVLTDNGVVYEENNTYQKKIGRIIPLYVETYISLFNRNDRVKILSEEGTDYIVLIQGFMAKIEKDRIRLDGAEKFKEFTGYSQAGTVVYYDHELTEEMTTLKKNQEVLVIDEIDNVYVILLDNGTKAYALSSNISSEKIITPVYTPKVEEKTYEEPSYTDSGSSSGGGGGGGGSDPTPAPSPTPQQEEVHINPQEETTIID